MKRLFILFLCALLITQGITGFSLDSSLYEDEFIESEFLNTVDWHGEYDVIVIGYGGAGASASIQAADEGADVLLLEKAPMGQEGGNTRFAGQAVLGLDESNLEKGMEYFKNLRGKFNTPDDGMIHSYLNYVSGNYDWLTSIGAENIAVFPFQEYDFSGGDVMQAMLVDGEMFTSSLYRLLQEAVEKRSDKIEVWYESPGVGLIQDPVTKIIHGVKVSNSGRLLNIRAKNGVILCTGGFENNQQMIQDYLQLPYGYSKAAKFNTGDGIKMAMEVGADLWHMSNAAGPDLNVLNPETNTTYAYAIQGDKSILSTGFATQNAIFVGADGTRFIDESVLPNHGHIDFHGSWIQMPLSLPAYAVFDETARLSQPVYNSWSDGNVDEIEKGIIIKADTLEDLAKKLGVNPDNLRKTVRNYNKYCYNRKDLEFGRNPKTLKTIKKAPYYAMELVPSFTNTQGGPVRNQDGQVLDAKGNPIPHLYSAGELGSMFSSIYQGTGNLGECVAFGRISGKNAADLKKDVKQETVMTGKLPQKAVWKEPDQIILKSGEYLGEARGIGGPIKVKVTIKLKKITGIEVVYHNETRGVSTNAISIITDEIIKKQSADVDAISGVTVSSKAIMAAVKNAIVKAGL